jgi:hypothetical protein
VSEQHPVTAPLSHHSLLVWLIQSSLLPKLSGDGGGRNIIELFWGAEGVTRRHVRLHQERHCLPGQKPTVRNRCYLKRKPHQQPSIAQLCTGSTGGAVGSLTLSCGMIGALLAALVRALLVAGLAPAPVGAPGGLRKGV